MEMHYNKIRAAILIASVVLLVFFPARSRWNRWNARPPERCPGAVVIVEVKGDVSRPGIYTLDSATANIFAVAAMAGCKWEIPPTLAEQKLACGQSLEVIHRQESVTIRLGRMPGAALLACGLKLDLNSASLDGLLLIPRMRRGIAASIIKRRRENAWEKLDDLVEIRGIGPKTVQKLRDYLETPSDGGRMGSRADAEGGPTGGNGSQEQTAGKK